MALFALGFRPFFLAAGWSAVAFMVAWLGIYFESWPVPEYYGTIGWHGHEMLFGYTVAVVAGFLLTAVRNWTGMETLSGGRLAALVALWLAGRVLPFMPGAPDWLIAAVDLAFLPMLALSLGPVLWRAGQRTNLVFLLLLALLTAANVVVHLSRLGVLEGAGGTLAGLQLGVGVIVLLIAVLGGRVIPFFIERGANAQVRVWPWIERAALASAALWLVASVFMHGTIAHEVLAWAAAAIHGLRLATWHRRGLWRVPLLWVLYTGYGWLVLGLALDAAAVAHWLAPAVAIHAFTAGAIGTMTLGMMARVALGHTGRPMQAAPMMVAAFLLINLSAFVRVVLGALLPAHYGDWLIVAGSLWIAAFAFFVIVYTPVLSLPRVDGRPG